MNTTSPSNHPESDALWQPEPLAVPSPHYTYTFADNYREDEYKFACGMEEQRNETMVVNLEHGRNAMKHDKEFNELTLERESLKEQLKKCEKSHKDLYDEAAGYLMAIGNKNIENQSLITQRNLDTECIERLQRKGAENEVKIAELMTTVATMVGALKWVQENSPLDFLGTGSSSRLADRDEKEWDKKVQSAIDNTPLAAKDLLERVEQLEKLHDAVKRSHCPQDANTALALHDLSTTK